MPSTLSKLQEEAKAIDQKCYSAPRSTRSDKRPRDKPTRHPNPESSMGSMLRNVDTRSLDGSGSGEEDSTMADFKQYKFQIIMMHCMMDRLLDLTQKCKAKLEDTGNEEWRPGWLDRFLSHKHRHEKCQSLLQKMKEDTLRMENEAWLWKERLQIEEPHDELSLGEITQKRPPQKRQRENPKVIKEPDETPQEEDEPREDHAQDMDSREAMSNPREKEKDAFLKEANPKNDEDGKTWQEGRVRPPESPKPMAKKEHPALTAQAEDRPNNTAECKVPKREADPDEDHNKEQDQIETEGPKKLVLVPRRMPVKRWQWACVRPPEMPKKVTNPDWVNTPEQRYDMRVPSEASKKPVGIRRKTLPIRRWRWACVRPPELDFLKTC